VSEHPSQAWPKSIKSTTAVARNIAHERLVRDIDRSATTRMLYGVEHQVRPASAGRPSRSIERLQGVEIRNPASVGSVIEEVPGMLDMLVDAVAILRKAFGRHAKGIAIQPFIDPESTDGVVHLFVLALTPLSFAESDQILQGVVSSWWEANAARAGGRVTIDTEFV
jgi:hypothetical protein